MNPSHIAAATALERRRISTGDPGLDRLLHGGLFRGAVTILQGTPGAGKTTLANQMVFENSRRGGHAVYITLLSESHARMMASLAPMSFFQEEDVGESIHYVSGYNVLLEDGAPGLLRLLGSEARLRQANLVVLDGLFVLGESGLSESQYRKFINDLSLQAELMGCTVLLLTNRQRSTDSPEYTMVDAWLELGRQWQGSRSSRYVEVHKLRGSGFIAGRHRLRISMRGLEALPRLESHPAVREAATPAGNARVGSGLAELDAMLHGGLPEGSTTLLWGPTGIGKTTLGMHFMAACTPEEPGLFFGFYETPDDCLASARERGIDLERPLADGSLQFLWHPPTEHDLDELGRAIIDHVRAHGTRRLFLDSIDAFEKVAFDADRLNRFLNALTCELRNARCTAVYVAEIPELFGEQPYVLQGDRSAVGQNILLMRYMQLGCRMQRALSIVKLRRSDFDHRAREFRITDAGIRILGSVDPRSPVATGERDGTAGAEG